MEMVEQAKQWIRMHMLDRRASDPQASNGSVFGLFPDRRSAQKNQKVAETNQAFRNGAPRACEGTRPARRRTDAARDPQETLDTTAKIMQGARLAAEAKYLAAHEIPALLEEFIGGNAPGEMISGIMAKYPEPKDIDNIDDPRIREIFNALRAHEAASVRG